MRLISGNGHEYIELENTHDTEKVFINTKHIRSVCSGADSRELFLSVEGWENLLYVKGTIPEFFATLGCNMLTSPENVPF